MHYLLQYIAIFIIRPHLSADVRKYFCPKNPWNAHDRKINLTLKPKIVSNNTGLT